ncbi:MAG: hypothetical protein K9M10_03725 [Candidatus Pacebacteria bacterium]|nr:hypothetical protein [Candidatus Paceibacterota bacterium]MCF7857561.1 hypothetical protein [Candidatus Paceibacterota bacterium]
MLDVKRIYIGSWFQRTTLHLSEIYDFMTSGESPLNLDKQKLKSLKDNLRLVSVEDIHSDFEYIHAMTEDGISLKIFEDGLILIGHDSEDSKNGIKETISLLTEYYEKALSEGLSYVFSLGAPIPKELANIKTVYPYFIVLEKASVKDIDGLIKEFGQTKHFEVKKPTFEIHRGDTLYIINTKGEKMETIEQFIGEQIFIREFKSQMHRYLNLHRVIWENIAEVKERGKIQGKEISGFKEKIEGYQKTINMIDTRINQMGAYINTRGAIVRNNPKMEKFIGVMQFKHETLNDTLGYVKEIWRMTKTYVDSALSVFGDLQAKATNSSIQNLTVVTSMGVGATLLGLFSKTELPQFKLVGLFYFALLAFIGWTVNRVMRNISLNKEYTIKDIKADRDIK